MEAASLALFDQSQGDCGQFEANLTEICGVCVTILEVAWRHGPGKTDRNSLMRRRIMLFTPFSRTARAASHRYSRRHRFSDRRVGTSVDPRQPCAQRQASRSRRRSHSLIEGRRGAFRWRTDHDPTSTMLKNCATNAQQVLPLTSSSDIVTFSIRSGPGSLPPARGK